MKLLMALSILGLATTAHSKTYGLLGANFSAPTIIGKENVYNPSAGEIVYDQSDATFYGRVHTEAWVPLSSGGSTSSSMPTGSVLTFTGPICPEGYIPADGVAISRSEYSALYAVIGTTHGFGNNIDTFNVPDYRGRFLRGAAGTSLNDPDKESRIAMANGGNAGNNIGSIQGHAFQTHSHSLASIAKYGNGIAGEYGWSRDDGISSSSIVKPTTAAGATGANSQPSTAETRPVNAYVNYCIKH